MDLPWDKMFVLVLSALVGGLLVMWRVQPKGLWMKLLTSFSGAYLFGICLTDLLPFSYHAAGYHAGVYVVAGFVFQLVLEFFSEGIEHGHAHHHKKSDKGFPFVVMVSLCAHALVEGMPFGHAGHEHADSMLMGIVFHNIPVAMILVGMMLQAGISKLETLIWLSVFALMGPLGTILFGTFIRGEAIETVEVMSGAVTAIAVGILLHVSTTILFEADTGHHFNLKKFLSVIIGFLAAILIF